MAWVIIAKAKSVGTVFKIVKKKPKLRVGQRLFGFLEIVHIKKRDK